MKYCVVPLCKGYDGHRFPVDEIRRQQWVAAIRRKDFSPAVHSIVCYNHFDEADYVKSTTAGQLLSFVPQ